MSLVELKVWQWKCDYCGQTTEPQIASKPPQLPAGWLIGNVGDWRYPKHRFACELTHCRKSMAAEAFNGS